MNEEDDDTPAPKGKGRPKRFVPPDDAKAVTKPKGKKVSDEELPKFPVIALGWEGSLGQTLAANGIGRHAQLKGRMGPPLSGDRSQAIRQSLLQQPSYKQPRRQADAGWVEATDVRDALISALRTLGRKSGPPSLSGQREDIEKLTDDGSVWWSPVERVYAFDPKSPAGKALFRATLADIPPGHDRERIIQGFGGARSVPSNYQESISLKEAFGGGKAYAMLSEFPYDFPWKIVGSPIKDDTYDAYDLNDPGDIREILRYVHETVKAIVSDDMLPENMEALLDFSRELRSEGFDDLSVKIESEIRRTVSLDTAAHARANQSDWENPQLSPDESEWET